MIRNIDTMFPEMNGCKTRKGAQARLDKLARCVEQSVPPTGRTLYLTTIVEREDGTFIPVAIVGSEGSYLARTIVDFKVGVTNV